MHHTTRKLVCMIRCQEVQWKKFIEEYLVQTLLANKLYSNTVNTSILTARVNSLDLNQIDPLSNSFLPHQFSATISLYLPNPDHQNAPEFPRLEPITLFHFRETYSKTDRYFVYTEHYFQKLFEVDSNFVQDILVQRLNRYIQRQSITLEGEIYEYGTNRILRCGQLGTTSGGATSKLATPSNIYFIEMESPGQSHLFEKFETHFYKQVLDYFDKLRHQDNTVIVDIINVTKPHQQQPQQQVSIPTTWERLVLEYLLFFRKVYQPTTTHTTNSTSSNLTPTVTPQQR